MTQKHLLRNDMIEQMCKTYININILCKQNDAIRYKSILYDKKKSIFHMDKKNKRGKVVSNFFQLNLYLLLAL